MMVNVRNRLKKEFIEKHGCKKIIKQPSKLTFGGNHKSYVNCDTFSFKHIEVLLDTPIYAGFAMLELSKPHMYETYYDKLQPDFGQEDIQLHYMDADSFVLGMKSENFIKDSKHLEVMFDFSNLDENHELFSEKKRNCFWKI